MSADHNPDGWTFATLYKHVMEMSTASKEAIGAALESMNRRLDGMNEFRQSLRDQQDTFAKKSETELRFDQITKRLDSLTDDAKVSSGKTIGFRMVLIVSAWLVTTLIALLAIFLHR